MNNELRCSFELHSLSFNTTKALSRCGLQMLLKPSRLFWPEINFIPSKVSSVEWWVLSAFCQFSCFSLRDRLLVCELFVPSACDFFHLTILTLLTCIYFMDLFYLFLWFVGGGVSLKSLWQKKPQVSPCDCFQICD